MIKIFCSLCCLLLIFPVSSVHGDEVITPEQAAEGWIALFDGESLLVGSLPPRPTWM
jgi:hypothetical protein